MSLEAKSHHEVTELSLSAMRAWHGTNNVKCYGVMWRGLFFLSEIYVARRTFFAVLSAFVHFYVRLLIDLYCTFVVVLLI